MGTLVYISPAADEDLRVPLATVDAQGTWWLYMRGLQKKETAAVRLEDEQELRGLVKTAGGMQACRFCHGQAR